MIKFIKKNIFIGLIFSITLTLGFVTFLTFIDKSFLKLTASFNWKYSSTISSFLYDL
jgi:hypothetical protein